ncbi:hypothetical protein CXB51_001640 [Gossypium anomalum]|uniref:Endonuclease/exonuclease/phosphatase domain-containing protein n=1 Tax=Gossypium anomalum TaxID=47600 RepID=A0A8J6DF61_9ROSI|nr:hypothetical protein CXB51_001640 [Gossypium anomalum]
MEMLITINQPNLIKELIMMEVGNCIFPIRVKERGLSKEKIENSLDIMNTLEEDGGESLELESRTKSESECCLEGRRNDEVGDINAISLEEGVIEKGGMQFLAENQMSEENFLGNNKSLSGEGVGTGLKTDRARKDMINMGFNNLVGPSEVCGNHNNVDQLAGSLGENGLCLERGSNPVESVEGGNGLGDRYEEDELVGFNFGEEGMRILSWNIRGLGSEVKKASTDGRVLVIEGRWIKEDLEVVLINNYAPNLASEQSVLWGVLMELRFQFASPWIMGGNFNVVRCRSERSRCMGSAKGSKEFDNFIHNCKLIDLPLVGKKFTWYGPDNKKSRLDRFLVEEHWLIKIKALQQMGLKRSVSDHIPILSSDAETD